MLDEKNQNDIVSHVYLSVKNERLIFLGSNMDNLKLKSDNRVENKIIYNENGIRISLQDGKKRWKERKTYGVNFAKIFHSLGMDEIKRAKEDPTTMYREVDGEIYVDSFIARRYFSKHKRMLECASRLDYEVNADGKKKLVNAYFCRERLCPMCMWRLSRRLAWETELIIAEYIRKYPNMVPIFISLTVQNPQIDKLSDMLDIICSGKSGAWQLLLKWLSRRGVKDYIRTVEVTFNYKKVNWHPHLHVLAFVPKEYFFKENKNYISQVKLAEYWQHACNLDYKPIVDIRRVYDKNVPKERISANTVAKDMNLSGAILETAKYCIKPLKLFSNTLDSYDNCGEDKWENEEELKIQSSINIKDVVCELDGALNRRRLRALGGEIKKIAHKLKFDGNEDKKDLLHNDNISLVKAVAHETYEYVFRDKDYYLTERRLFKQEEKQEEKKIFKCSEILLRVKKAIVMVINSFHFVCTEINKVESFEVYTKNMEYNGFLNDKYFRWRDFG